MGESFAETSTGLLMIADGFSPVLRWDGHTAQCEEAGVAPPAVAVSLAGSGVGGIVGNYYAFLRYVDRSGNFSNLSPLSALFTPTGASGAVTDASNATPIVITSAAHGLTTGAIVRVSGVGGNTSANDTWAITVLDADTFSLDTGSGTADYTGGGTWTSGVGAVTYTLAEVPQDPKVARRQILRNTDGQASVFYVDVDTTDLTGGTFTSTLTDSFLAAQAAVPILDPEGNVFANRYTVPPAHKKFLAQHKDRMFLGGQEDYTQGNVQVTFGSATVQGVGTDWTSSFAGRSLYVAGAGKPYAVSAVDVPSQVLTLAETYADATDLFALYGVRPAPGEDRLVYYCCDEATEILTRDGWKKQHQLMLGELVLTLNPETNAIEWGPIEDVNVWPFHGHLNYWHTNRFNAATTDGHRWLAKGCGMMGGHWTLRAGDRRTHFVTSEEINARVTAKHLVTSGGEPSDHLGENVVEDEFAELAGWYIAEGHEQETGKTGVVVWQSLKKNPQHVATIRRLRRYYADRGCTATEGKHQDNGWGPIVPFYFGKGIGDRLRKHCPDKALTPDFLLALRPHQLRILYTALMGGDGHKRNDSLTEQFAQKNRATAAAFQMLCAMLGRRSYSRDSKHFDCACVTIYQPGHTNTNKLKKERVPYTGLVWCPTTKNGTWMARRHGCTYWTGNSEAGLPEAWPATNALAVVDDGDEITGLMPQASWLYILERRHVYRLTFEADPGADGAIFLAANRGCVNNRCWVVVDDAAYLLDEQGVHRFGGGQDSESVSTQIQQVFKPDGGAPFQINWSARANFHAVLYLPQETIRWFVCLSGDRLPRHALCYSYPAGPCLYNLGGLWWKYKTGWWRFAPLEEDNERRVEAVFQPLKNAATMDLRVFYDFSADPAAWGADLASADGDGVASADGSPDLVVDLTKRSGVVQKRFGWHRELYTDGQRFTQLELGGFTNKDPVAVWELNYDGVTGRGGEG